MLEGYFQQFRNNTIGHDLQSDINGKSIVYADWTASGRLYQPIENLLSQELGPYVANPHTDNNEIGRVITHAYRDARQAIKSHVNANKNDVLICTGAGATSAILKLQRLLGLKEFHSRKNGLLQRIQKRLTRQEKRPVVFVSHMEHHSNHTSWNECNVDVVVIKRDANGQPCQQDLNDKLIKYKNRSMKIGAFTACSNVTGIKTEVHKLAKTMHLANGFIFVDYACSAPYVDINMHPADPLEQLDGIYFSPHKFLGGPGSCGVLVFNSALYQRGNLAPDRPGGGTVLWTNPWGQQAYFSDIEKREDGGTPAFMQTIKAAAAIKLKENMTVAKITQRESYLCELLMNGISEISGAKILEEGIKERLCIVAFYLVDVHYNLVIRLLSDKFGIQARGGCSCAGTYGHILLGVNKRQSTKITEQLNNGNLAAKPGWVRISLHPTNTDAEAYYIVNAIKQISENIALWEQEYEFNPSNGDFLAKHLPTKKQAKRTLLWA